MSLTADYITQIQGMLIVQFNVENNSNEATGTVVLIGGAATFEKTKEHLIKVGTFQSLNNDVELNGISSFNLENIKQHDSLIPANISSIMMKVTSSNNQLDGCEKPIVVVTQDRLGNETEVAVKGVFDDESRKFVFPINQVIGLNQYVKFELLPSLKLSVEVVYA
ncbi:MULTISPECIES: hypothetical protein [unclassified Arcicella]|uniref:hypothetical protein n=1 Tax=unclassified Arcicella TaxID=2644986 RepID=UPI002865091D|nr:MULTISPECIES: hypothetical protein [unclassified Arcicella]MDR6564948.1 hypothetical protein [Arcicella sp. BE51]MDR6814738.1 hypothetical protein [Arcicella sp. BE140]MDR6826184.1 hypothetical protein [Arcicella sp. BE139]